MRKEDDKGKSEGQDSLLSHGLGDRQLGPAALLLTGGVIFFIQSFSCVCCFFSFSWVDTITHQLCIVLYVCHKLCSRELMKLRLNFLIDRMGRKKSFFLLVHRRAGIGTCVDVSQFLPDHPEPQSHWEGYL